MVREDRGNTGMMKNCTHMAPIGYGLLDSWREWKQSRCGRPLHATAHPFGDEEFSLNWQRKVKH